MTQAKEFRGRAGGRAGLFEHGDLRAGLGEVIGDGRADDAGAHDANAQRARSAPTALCVALPAVAASASPRKRATTHQRARALGLAAQLRMVAAVAKVNEKADRQPDRPGAPRC